MDINVGDKIELLYEKDIYKSQVQDIINDTQISVSNPISKGYDIYIPVDANVVVRYFKENACYQFLTYVMSKTDMHGVRSLNLEKISDIEKIQRRKFYRIELVLPIMFKRHDEKEYKRAIMKNISGGGVKISSDVDFKRGEKIDLKINIDNLEINICGTIIRVDKNNNINNIGIEFKEIDKVNREKIIKFIFKKQRERIKRG